MRQFKWESVFQVLGNVGVIIGIAFLVVETRQNNEALEAQSRAQWVDRQVESLGNSTGN